MNHPTASDINSIDSPTEMLLDRDAQSIDTLPSIPTDNQYFRDLMATFRAERELDDDNPAYTVNDNPKYSDRVLCSDR
jgi:hypothetical protein